MDEKNMVGQLPVKEIYNDLLHPAVSTVGKSMGDIVRISLTPVSALVWGYDQVSDYLSKAIPEYFAKKKIKSEDIITPDPLIAVPTIESLRICTEHDELKEALRNLLGASMVKGNNVHPSFVNTIKQLSSDECKMLYYLYTKENKLPIIKIRQKLDSKGEIDITNYFSNICYKAGCIKKECFPEYLDNLDRLGLVCVTKNRFLVNDELYSELEGYNEVLVPLEKIDTERIVKSKGIFEISPLGIAFCKICL